MLMLGAVMGYVGGWATHGGAWGLTVVSRLFAFVLFTAIGIVVILVGSERESVGGD